MRLSCFFLKHFLSAALIICFSVASAQDAKSYYDQGEKFLENKDFDAAIKSYTTAISKNAAYAEAFIGRGFAYVQTNQKILAIQDYTKAISLNGSNAEIYISRGDLYLEDDQDDLALKDFTKAIQLDQGNAGAYASRGDYYSKKTQFDLSIQDFTKAIQLDPAYYYGYSRRGDVYIDQIKLDLAIKDYTKAISLEPENSDAYISRGHAYYLNDSYESALEDFTNSIKLNADNADAYVRRGDVYVADNQFDLALKDFTKAISLDANHARAYSSLANLYLDKYEYDLCIQNFTKAISLDPSDNVHYHNRGLAYNQLGKYELSIQDFTTCLEIEKKISNNYADKDAEYGKSFINIISPLVRMQRFADAKSYYDQYKQLGLTSHLETEDYKFYISFLAAVTEINKGMFTEAKVSLEKAIAEYGTELKDATKRSLVDILYLGGYVLEKMDLNEDAKIVYEQSLAIDNLQPDLENALKRLEKKQTATRSLDNTPPEITLINPTPTRGFEIVADNIKTQIIGRAKDDAGIKSIKINNTVVEKIEEDGLFIVSLVLKSGSNSLVISATDKQDNTASKTFVINGSATASNAAPAPEQSMISPGQTPKYYAILIAEKDYADEGIPDLQNPIRDAKELKAILESKYTFNTTDIDTLYNKSREEIMQAIVQRCNTLTENDNLLIFYAGHGIGEKDKFGDVDGYWIPTSAKKGLNASYISSDDINKAVKRSNAKHILIIADACFSGAFTRALPADASKLVAKQYAVPSRKVMASGNIEPVPDNSKLLFFLKQSLNDNKEKYLTAKDLFDGMYKKIINNTDNLPQYAAIKNVGDEGGEFIFIKK